MKGIRASRGFSSVLTSILMCGVVISIGISIWGFTHGAATVMRSDYYDEVMESVYKIKERFTIENIGVNISAAPSIDVWVLNYGTSDINITKIRITGGGNSTYYYPPDNNDEAAPNGDIISAGDFKLFNTTQTKVVPIKGLSLTICVEREGEQSVWHDTDPVGGRRGGSPRYWASCSWSGY